MEVRGWKFDVGGSGFEVRGSRFGVRGSRHEVRGSKFLKTSHRSKLDHENALVTCFVHAEAREEC